MPCGDQVGGQLVCETSPKPREITPEVGTLEDPDEGSPVHMREKQKKRNETVSFRCQGGKNVILKLFQVLKHFSLRKLHVHNIIIIHPLHICCDR